MQRMLDIALGNGDFFTVAQLVYATKQSTIQVKPIVASYDYGVRDYEQGSKRVLTTPLPAKSSNATSPSNLAPEQDQVSLSRISLRFYMFSQKPSTIKRAPDEYSASKPSNFLLPDPVTGISCS